MTASISTAPSDVPVRRESVWAQFEGGETAELLCAAMAHGGVERLYFTSGSDVLFLQEAVAKRQALGRPTPTIVMTLHEAVALNAAMGETMLTRGPAATAVHVDVGTLNYGCGLHTVFAGGYPVLMVSGSPARSYPGEMKGGRDHPIYWMQERFDQRALAREYTKWSFRLELQDNPGLVVSRGLQIALSPPHGPAFLTVPREVGMAQAGSRAFPTVDQLGLLRPMGPDPDAIDELASWLLEAERPLVITGRNGKDPESVAGLVRIAELVGAHVSDSQFRDRMNFPSTHPLMLSGGTPSEADVVVVLDRKVPWVPAGNRTAGDIPDDPTALSLGHPAGAPGAACRIAWIGEDPGVFEIPVIEHPGDLRIPSDPTLALRMLAEALEDRIDAAGRDRARERIEAGRARKRQLGDRYEADAHAARDRAPIDPRWLTYQLGRITDDEAVLLDESLSNATLLRRYHKGDRPASFFAQGGSGGGWGSGAAVGAKLAEPDRDVILAAGDGFYGFGNPALALWTAIRHGAPYLAVVFVNASFSTGKDQVLDYYGQESYSKAAGFEGGVFDPPPDYAAEARAAGAHGEYVDDPHELEQALKRGLDATRNGQPAVVAVRIN